MSDDLQLLRDGEIEILGRIVEASNATLLCTITLGERTEHCVYKPVLGERPLWDFPDGTLAGRELASYAVSEATGWGIVPPTVLRDGPAGSGMVQLWMDGDDEVDVIELINARPESLRRMAVLDAVINNSDRKGGHVLLGLDERVRGVDHGICLHADPKLRTVLWGWAGQRIDAELLADIAGLADTLGSDGPLAAELDELLTIAEVEALLGRIEGLLDVPVMPHPGQGHMIPWPPF